MDPGRRLTGVEPTGPVGHFVEQSSARGIDGSGVAAGVDESVGTPGSVLR
jgi:hypothetical protein